MSTERVFNIRDLDDDFMRMRTEPESSCEPAPRKAEKYWDSPTQISKGVGAERVKAFKEKVKESDKVLDTNLWKLPLFVILLVIGLFIGKMVGL